MKKRMIIIVALVVLVAVGAMLFISNKNNSKNSTSSSTSNKNAHSGNSSGAFDALPNTDTSFTATITTTVSNKDSMGKMEYDNNSGNVKYSVSSDGQNLTMVYTKDAYYMCQAEDKCLKYALGQSGGSGFDPSSYKYDSSKLAALNNGAVEQGEKSCPAGTCHVWKVSSEGQSTTIYIDTKTKRISQIESISSTSGSTKIVYEYKDVTVVPPTNVTELPTMNQ